MRSGPVALSRSIAGAEDAGQPDVPTNLHGGNRSIGAILMDAGLLSSEGAERILRLQKQEGLLFGDAAMQLGLLSESDLRFALSGQFSYPYIPASGGKPVSDELVAAFEPFSPLVEQLRSIRSQLLLRWCNKDAHRNTLAIVGASREEGRSYLAANLAVVFSQLGERTLLIDADLRTPRQHALFKLDNKSGLSNLLAGRADQSAIVSITELSNLDVLPAGPVPPNPLELLNRDAFRDVLARASQDYEIVLVDTPAMDCGADANILAVRAGAALAVARNNQTRVGAFGEMVQILKRSGVMVVGSVFNDPPLIKA